MYVAGGAESWNCLNSVERYNPENNTWTLVAPMNVARRGAGIAVHAGALHSNSPSSSSSLAFLTRLPPSRQTVCCGRFRRLPRPPLRGSVRPRPQRVEDAGQHDVVPQQRGPGHTGRDHLRRGRLRRQRVPQHGGGVQPCDGRVERLRQHPVPSL